MKRSAAPAMSLLPAIILVSLSAVVFTASAACHNVTTMKMDDVCYALPFPEWSHVCWETLSSSPSAPKTAELTEYVIMAARNSSLRYEGTLNTIKEMLTAGRRLTGKEREAYSFCRDQYEEAIRLMASWVDHLPRCDFTHITDEEPVGACAEKLKDSLLEKKPIFDYVCDDESLAMVVLELGRMLTGKPYQ